MSFRHEKLIMRSTLFAGGAILAAGSLAMSLYDNEPDEPANDGPVCMYIVQPEDTLSSISNQRSSTTDELMDANGGTTYIIPGQQILLDRTLCEDLAETGTQLHPVPVSATTPTDS